MKQIQTALLNATGPLFGLWSEIQKKGLEREGGLIQVPVVLETIQRTLVLLGNSNCLLSEKRHLGILKSVDPQLEKYAKGDFSDSGKHLFGNKFVKEIVSRVQADTAICKALAITKQGERPNSLVFSMGPDWGMGPALAEMFSTPCY